MSIPSSTPALSGRQPIPAAPVNTIPNPLQPPSYIPGLNLAPQLPIDDPEVENALIQGMLDSRSGAADYVPDGALTSGIPSGPDAFNQPQQPAASGSSSTNPACTTYLYDPTGNRIALNPSTTAVPVGGGTVLNMAGGDQAVFTPNTLTGPAANPTDNSRTYNNEDEINSTYAGSDMRVMIELHPPSLATNDPNKPVHKQLIELTTVSVSVHRVKSPVRSCGYINPRGFARGSRTIAGTIILTQFTVDVMYRFLYDAMATQDLSKDSFYLKPDQLPPFDMTLMFADEYGNASSRRLLGVDCVTDGTVYSINDLFTEQTISYMAADFTPLMPLNRTSLIAPAANTAATVQKTPMQSIPKESVTSTINYNLPGTQALPDTKIPSGMNYA